jgi:HlyD family type I secretion membrane fusion protein
MQATRDALKLSRDSLSMNQSLHDQQFVSRSRLLTEERTVADYEARLHEFDAALSQVRQRENDVRLRIAAAKNAYQQQAHEEQRESGRRLAELRERLRPLESQVQRQVIASPVDGQVVGLRYFGAAQVVGPRDVIMQIVPRDDELIVEVQVPVDEIKSVRAGQEASLRLTAYDARTTPRIRGQLTYVSADALNDKDGRPYYQAHVQPDPSELATILREPLQPGMAAEVFILTRERSALAFLLDPVKQALDRSMRER